MSLVNHFKQVTLYVLHLVPRYYDQEFSDINCCAIIIHIQLKTTSITLIYYIHIELRF